MSLTRVPLTLAAAFAFHVSMSPPSTPDSETSDDRRAIRAAARFLASVLTKGLFWASTVTDALIVLAPYVPASLPTLLPVSIPPLGGILSWIRQPAQWGPGLGLGLSLSLGLPASLFPHLPLVTIAGTALTLAGAYLRYTAFDALGQFYACPNTGPGPCVQARSRGHRHRDGHGHAHALITTGPYRFIRHPGYAGLVLCTAGLVMLQLDALKVSEAGAWVGGERAGMMRTVALLCAILAALGALRRIRDEEQALRMRFKGEWVAWAERVQYKLVPGVF